MDQLNQDRMVTLLLCSDLGLTQDMKKRCKPYTTPQWNKLMDTVIHSRFFNYTLCCLLLATVNMPG